MSASWRYDLNRMAYICSDGRFVTEEALLDRDPAVASLMREALELEVVSGPDCNPLARVRTVENVGSL